MPGSACRRVPGLMAAAGIGWGQEDGPSEARRALGDTGAGSTESLPLFTQLLPGMRDGRSPDLDSSRQWGIRRSQPYGVPPVGVQDTWDTPLPATSPMSGNFPTAKDKEELRGRPCQCWDNGALCPGNQSRSRKAKGRWGPSCLHPGKPCLPEPHPETLPSWVEGGPGQILHGPPREGGAECIRQTMQAPQWPLCVRFPQEERKEPSPVAASCWAGITTGGIGAPPAYLGLSGAQT